MNLNQVYGRTLLEHSLLELKQMAPFIKDARIDTRPGDDGTFVTRIEVHLKRHRHLVAIKRDTSLRRSVHKARDAIMKQLVKTKERYKSRPGALREAMDLAG